MSQDTVPTTKKHGGKNPGGRPPKDPADKVVKCRISMTQAHHAATEGDRAGMIRRALEFYPGDVDTCITGTIESIEYITDDFDGGIAPRFLLIAHIWFVGGAKVKVPVQRTAFYPGDKVKVAFCDGHTNIQKINLPSGDKQSEK